MNINDIFPSKYLKAADLKGQARLAVIKSCEIEEMGDQRKLVIHFQNQDKGMVCNKTNADRIAFMYSPDTDNWIGKEIVIYADMVTYQGKVMEGLRIRPPTKRNGKVQIGSKAPPPDPTDDLPEPWNDDQNFDEHRG